MTESDSQDRHSPEPEVRKFRCAIGPLFAVTFCLGMTLGFAMIFIRYGLELDTNGIALTFLVGAAFCLFTTTFIVFCIPVIVTPACLAAPNWWGDYEAVAWEDVRTVKRFNFLGLRYLIVNGSILVPLFLADKKGFLETVAAYGDREDNRLVQGLEESLRRT